MKIHSAIHGLLHMDKWKESRHDEANGIVLQLFVANAPKRLSTGWTDIDCGKCCLKKVFQCTE
jgi:hypothetical protein